MQASTSTQQDKPPIHAKNLKLCSHLPRGTLFHVSHPRVTNPLLFISSLNPFPHHLQPLHFLSPPKKMADQQYHHQIHDQHVQQHHPQQLQQKGQQAIENFKTFLQEKAPKTPQLLTIVTLLPIGASLLFLAGLALTGSVIGLVIMTPLFVIFSPVIVPAIVVIGLSVLGFLTSGAFGLTGVSAISWIVNFLRSVRVGSGLEHGVHETGEYVGRKVKEMGQDVRDWGHEAGSGRAWE